MNREQSARAALAIVLLLCAHDHDFQIAFHSKFLSGIHGFRDNKVLLQARYDVIMIFPPGDAPRNFS